MEETYKGSCHCGKVKFELIADIDHVRVCDCSICSKRSALNFRVNEDQLKILTPLTELTLYQWHTRTAKDYFCPVCGILPFRRPSAPTPTEVRRGMKPFSGWAINIRCLEGFDFQQLPVRDIKGSALE